MEEESSKSHSPRTSNALNPIPISTQAAEEERLDHTRIRNLLSPARGLPYPPSTYSLRWICRCLIRSGKAVSALHSPPSHGIWRTFPSRRLLHRSSPNSPTLSVTLTHSAIPRRRIILQPTRSLPPRAPNPRLISLSPLATIPIHRRRTYPVTAIPSHVRRCMVSWTLRGGISVSHPRSRRTTRCQFPTFPSHRPTFPTQRITTTHLNLSPSPPPAPPSNHGTTRPPHRTNPTRTRFSPASSPRMRRRRGLCHCQCRLVWEAVMRKKDTVTPRRRHSPPSALMKPIII